MLYSQCDDSNQMSIFRLLVHVTISKATTSLCSSVARCTFDVFKRFLSGLTYSLIFELLFLVDVDCRKRRKIIGS
jgi:hypothetical protein